MLNNANQTGDVNEINPEKESDIVTKGATANKVLRELLLYRPNVEEIRSLDLALLESGNEAEYDRLMTVLKKNCAKNRKLYKKYCDIVAPPIDSVTYGRLKPSSDVGWPEDPQKPATSF